jgi:hypothetical protein
MADGIRVDALFPTEGLAALDAAGPAEILVGIPALNHARSVTHVVEAAATGLVKHFPGRKTMVLVADAGSQDGTLEAVRAWREAGPAVPVVQGIRLAGSPHRGRAILAVLAAARRLQAQGCALVDADLLSITPEWVDRLLHPVLRHEADYVSPAYTRAVSEGTLTTNLLAPMVQALYGKRLQQPLGGCAGLSGEMLGPFLQADGLAGEMDSHEVDLRLTIEALTSGAKVVETHLGRKLVAPTPAQPDLATIVARVVGALFHLMELYHAAWNEIRGSALLPHAGDPAGALADLGEPNVERMVRAFRLGLKDLLPVWEQVMPEETLARLYPLGLLAADEFQLPQEIWARVVSDFALAYHERRLPREHLLRALTPLYLGRAASFLLEAQRAPRSQLPKLLEAIGRVFEAEKEFLRARWR